jgi:CTP:molybdopterin cytidylyltransferase MocA
VKANLQRRLKQLEQVRAAVVTVASYREQEEECRLAREKMREWLHAQGAEQGPRESLAEAVARASGITCHELRQQLMEHAAGRP